MNQADAILAHLQTGAELTPLDALQRFGCLRLAARVYDLRRDGVQINERIERKGRKYWAVYSLGGIAYG